MPLYKQSRFFENIRHSEFSLHRSPTFNNRALHGGGGTQLLSRWSAASSLNTIFA
ncbi:MAG: hypothetical protein IPL35_17640 [Sphingobacteriales bacterium]|nr:hypothetical protein [Sphingobacteriales bacterium]